MSENQTIRRVELQNKAIRGNTIIRETWEKIKMSQNQTTGRDYIKDAIRLLGEAEKSGHLSDYARSRIIAALLRLEEALYVRN